MSESSQTSGRSHSLWLLFSFEGVVQVHLGPPKNILADNNRKYGGVAQLGEHLPCKQGVRSSILLVSTILLNLEKYIEETEKKETS